MIRMGRTEITLGIAIIIIALFGLTRPPSPISGTDVSKFWGQKMLWSGCFDIVLAGDSRIYRGVSPAAMSPVLGIKRIGNFGFSGNGYGHKYLQHLPQLFAKDARKKILILGITPNTLTEKAANQDSGYLAHLSDNPMEQYVNTFFGDFLNIFRPFEYRDLKNRRYKTKQGYFQKHYPDGWVASYNLPEDPNDALDEYEQNWRDQKVSPHVMDHLLAQIKIMQQQGIEVYGFEPPTANKPCPGQTGRPDERFLPERIHPPISGGWRPLAEHSQEVSFL